MLKSIITELLRNAPFVILNGVPLQRDGVKNLSFMRVWNEILRPMVPTIPSEGRAQNDTVWVVIVSFRKSSDN